MELLGTVNLSDTGVLVYNASADNMEKLETALELKEQGIREQIAQEIEATRKVRHETHLYPICAKCVEVKVLDRAAAIARGQK